MGNCRKGWGVVLNGDSGNMKLFMISSKIEVRNSPLQGKGLFATANISKGEVLLDLEARIISKPAYYGLQIDPRHYLVANYPDNFINHACIPNVYVKLHPHNRKRVTYLAWKNIRKGRELFWNYNTSEWDSGKEFSFICKCGSRNCIGKMQGMKYLSVKEKKRLWTISTSYIQEMIKSSLK